MKEVQWLQSLCLFEELSVIKRILTALLCAVLILSLFGCKGNLKSGELIIEEGESEINLAMFDVDTLNPIRTKSQSVSEIMSLVYEPLFTFDEKLNPIPCLGELVSVSADGLTARLMLKKNVVWQSGMPFVADDVIYTINEIKNGESLYSHNVESISEATVDADGSIMLTFSKPNMNLEGLLSFPIIRNGSAAEIANNPDGTGVFSVVEKSATTIKMTADKTRAKGSVSAVNVDIMRSAIACLNAFETNKLDVITSAVVDLGEKTPAGEISTNLYTSNRMTFLGFNCTLEKYKTPYLRLAINEIVDRGEIAAKASYGLATECRLPFNPNSSIYKETEGPDIDVSGAMLKAGYTKTDGKYLAENGEQALVDIIVSEETAGKVAVAEMVAMQLEMDGIKANVSTLPFDEYKRRITAKNFDIFVGEVEMPDNLCPGFLTDEGNFFGYQDAQMSEAVYGMKLARGDAMKEAVLNYERIFSVNPPLVPLFFTNEGVVYKKNLSGITVPIFYNNLKGLEKVYFTTA